MDEYGPFVDVMLVYWVDGYVHLLMDLMLYGWFTDGIDDLPLQIGAARSQKLVYQCLTSGRFRQ